LDHLPAKGERRIVVGEHGAIQVINPLAIVVYEEAAVARHWTVSRSARDPETLPTSPQVAMLVLGTFT
jgi:hypothetical protein